MNRVLIVDDSKLIRNAATKMLGAEFDVVVAEDGAVAKDLLQHDPLIRVVFTDLDMPNLNGYELLRDIRTSADPHVRGLPVIVVTGVEDDEVARLRALELGATDFITKPFATIDLLARARAHASHQRETAQLRVHTTLDPPTGLANKAGFLDRLQQDIAYARRHEQPLSLARIEIENFRAVFLQRGKDVGERLLKHVATHLRAAIRTEDSAGRVTLGGFALSLPASERQGIERMLERVRASIANDWASIVGDDIPMALAGAVWQPPLDSVSSAVEALDQARLLPLGAAEAVAAPPPKVPDTPQSAGAFAVPTPLRIDPLLEQIDRGNTQPAIAGMPLVLRRLTPLLRLLTPTQRDGLMVFLRQLHAPRN
jgi:diguanylate cyclase (GGDEF)-like protein